MTPFTLEWIYATDLFLLFIAADQQFVGPTLRSLKRSAWASVFALACSAVLFFNAVRQDPHSEHYELNAFALTVCLVLSKVFLERAMLLPIRKRLTPSKPSVPFRTVRFSVTALLFLGMLAALFTPVH